MIMIMMMIGEVQFLGVYWILSFFLAYPVCALTSAILIYMLAKKYYKGELILLVLLASVVFALSLLVALWSFLPPRLNVLFNPLFYWHVPLFFILLLTWNARKGGKHKDWNYRVIVGLIIILITVMALSFLS